ncbi:MAG TPA: energy transducer TonB [Pyrinomonadaceae bacterium]|nr:energy transducer TonB [Pyrinomonadaceae bacterium]
MYFRRLHCALAIVMLAAVAVAGQVTKSSANWSEWESITPEGEEFTVTMPKNPTTEAGKFTYHKMELNARLYLASQPSGAVLAIASLSGIKSNPAAYSDFARFNSYIDAFKDYFPPKVRTKDTAVTKLVLVSSRPFHGHTGRSYKLSIGELNGVAHAFATRKRFYVVVSLNTKKDDALEDKFLSSFVLPERQPDQPKIAEAANEQQPAPSAEQTAQNAENSEQKPGAQQAAGAEGNTENTAEPKTPNNNNQPNAKKPINGGMLNAKAIYMPQPELGYGEAAGVVLVQVLVDESGNVVEARAISGPQHLHAPAVNAARLARFSPTMLMGEAVKVAGTLSYNFAKSN